MNTEYDIAVVGLAVMGQNLILNMSDHDIKVVAYNRTVSKVEEFKAGAAKNHPNIYGATSTADMIAKLKRPRKVMLMVRAGDAVDAFIEQVLPHLEDGDIIIDGGNSNYPDTVRRVEYLQEKGIAYVGSGVSGGEEGARFGPSIMPGGNSSAWETLKPIFQSISAKTDDGTPCCDWVGDSGSGHFVKMVHNGIEYGDMQLIAEIYDVMKRGLSLDNKTMADTFVNWNKGILDSYLIEITGEILARKESDGTATVDTILDAAGQKGTGKWTLINGADAGIPLTLIGESVFARSLSARLDERAQMSETIPDTISKNLTDQISVDDLEKALFAAKLISYTQGFMLIDEVNREQKWNIDLGAVALMWRGGCIIRSGFLNNIHEAYRENPSLISLLAAPYFRDIMKEYESSLRKVVAAAITAGIPVPSLAAGLTFFDGYRTKRLPANLIQAQRDYFGAHTYEKVGGVRGEFFHTDWIESGGVSSSTYNA